MKKYSLLIILSMVFALPIIGQYPYNYLKPNKKNGWDIFSINQLIMSLLSNYGNENSLCIAEKVQQNYTRKEVAKWKTEERDSALIPFIVACVYPEVALEIESRKLAAEAIQSQKYADAIPYLLSLAQDSVAGIKDLNNLGWCYLLTKQFSKALKFLKQAESIDNSDLYVQGNLAHAYLFSHEEEKAFALYKKYKGYNIDASKSWETSILEDIVTFERLGIKHERFEEIRQLISKE